MIQRTFQFVVTRKRISHEYKKAEVPDSWENGVNDNNCMLDTLDLLKDGVIICHLEHMQTVANIPGGRYQNTIAPGDFYIVWRADPRQHRGPVHRIVEAYDLEGQKIDDNSVESVPGKDGAPVDFARWLVHDDQKLITSPPGNTRICWSAGCFVGQEEDMRVLAVIGDDRGLQPGDWIPCKLVEV